tara:strand:- start:137 stop:850 length:714 start_codon:yes stop_codon:yes gene_type:complete
MSSVSSSIQGIILETTDYDFNSKFIDFVNELDSLVRSTPACNYDVNDTRNIITKILNGKLFIQMIHEDAELILRCSKMIHNQVAIFNTKLKDITFAFLADQSKDFNIMNSIGTIGDAEKRKGFMKQRIENKSNLRRKLLENMDINGTNLTSGDYMEFYFLNEILNPTQQIDDAYYDIFMNEFDSIVFLEKTSEISKIIKGKKRLLAINLFIIFFTISLIAFNLKLAKQYSKKISKIF